MFTAHFLSIFINKISKNDKKMLKIPVFQPNFGCYSAQISLKVSQVLT